MANYKDLSPCEPCEPEGGIPVFPCPTCGPTVHSLKNAPGGQFVKRHPQRETVTSTAADGSTSTGGAGSQRVYKPMR